MKIINELKRDRTKISEWSREVKCLDVVCNNGDGSLRVYDCFLNLFVYFLIIILA